MDQNAVVSEGLKIYFKLVKEGFIKAKEPEGELYFSEAYVREFVKMCANQSGTEVLESTENIHLVVSSGGSLFATPFSELKEKLGLQNQEEFHVLCIIALVYLAEVDGNLLLRNRAEVDGVSYIKLIRVVENVLSDWLQKIKENPKFEEQWGIDIQSIGDFFLHKQLKDEKVTRLVPSFRTKISIVHKIMTFLREQKLVKIYESSDNYMIYPTGILYERLELAYSEDNRYESLKHLILSVKEEHQYARDF